MKCPKCNYIGFEATDRCRNCGFDFSLAPVVDSEADRPLRMAEPMGPLADFDLGDARRPPRVTPSTRAARRRQDPSFDPGVPPAGLPSAGAPPAPDPADLPLFGDFVPVDVPLVRPSAPGPPLAVRRSTPVPARPRPAAIPRGPERQVEPVLPLDSTAELSTSDAPRPTNAPADRDVAAIGERVGAAALDWLMLLALDAAIVYFTLRVSRLTTAEFALLPPRPLLAFLLLLNGGYLALFTAASGQTIGKMAFGLKVVSSEDRPLTVGRALVRVVALLVSALPAGLGLVPAVLDHARRGLHDRLADTRVVRATTS
jgi:uncharacterized RDD family membrane protein YckC